MINSIVFRHDISRIHLEASTIFETVGIVILEGGSDKINIIRKAIRVVGEKLRELWRKVKEFIQRAKNKILGKKVAIEFSSAKELEDLIKKATNDGEDNKTITFPLEVTALSSISTFNIDFNLDIIEDKLERLLTSCETAQSRGEVFEKFNEFMDKFMPSREQIEKARSESNGLIEKETEYGLVRTGMVSKGLMEFYGYVNKDKDIAMKEINRIEKKAEKVKETISKHHMKYMMPSGGKIDLGDLERNMWLSDATMTLSIRFADTISAEIAMIMKFINAHISIYNALVQLLKRSLGDTEAIKAFKNKK